MSLRSKTKTIDIYIRLAQYPILSDEIRRRMREELVSRGIITEQAFESEVTTMATESQVREGLHDPFEKEPQNVWSVRKARIRAFHTDFYFAYNLHDALFDNIIKEVVHGQHSRADLALKFNPELAPWRLLFSQGQKFEQMPPPELKKIQHHLMEIKVVLIRGMITDQLPLIGVAREVLSVGDLKKIYDQRIGRGKIGGKAAGMVIAWKILQQQDPAIGADMSENVSIPKSYFLGTDEMYEFRRRNNFEYIMNQKYKSIEEIRTDYDEVMQTHLDGDFSDQIESSLRTVLEDMGDSPLIVRSSSLLEDNFGSAFAGKYDSYFCPNQGSAEQNLCDLLDGIKRVYASTLSPDAILYRRQHGLIDYDERMAILIQEVKGERFKGYYFPTLAGVGFSQNPFRWSPKIRREDGFLRMVWGMGTRAVDRVSKDYPRLISLSHPKLRPETTASAIRQYSQRAIDVIDLKANEFTTIDVHDVLSAEYPYLRYIVSAHENGYIKQLVSVLDVTNTDDLILTFDSITHDPKFVKMMRNALRRIEKTYGVPVDIEFAIRLVPKYPKLEYHLDILQCRPLSLRDSVEPVHIPRNLDKESILFTEHQLVPDGKVCGIRYIIFVDPKRYRHAPTQSVKLELGRAIGRINEALKNEKFIIMGPGRWGSSNIELGVRVGYADIYNTKVLIEIAVETEQGVPELSYGTHFFQDLVEAGISTLPLHLNQSENYMDWAFFYEQPNQLAAISPQDADLVDYLIVIDLAGVQGNKRLAILMDGAADEAVGYLQSGNWDQGTHSSGQLGATVSTGPDA